MTTSTIAKRIQSLGRVNRGTPAEAPRISEVASIPLSEWKAILQKDKTPTEATDPAPTPGFKI